MPAIDDTNQPTYGPIAERFPEITCDGYGTSVRPAALMAELVRSRPNQLTTGSAPRSLCWTVDCEVEPAGLFVVAEH